MTKQIAVRLSDELVEFVDQIVRNGESKSRAAVVTRALERERRRRAAERDVAILIRSAGEDDDDLDSFVRVATRTPLADLD